MRTLVRGILISAIIALCAFAFVQAAQLNPTGPSNIAEVLDTRLSASNYPGFQNNADAGNKTKLSISTVSPTLGWQGYWGDISGNITLDDAQNFTFYSWTLAEPQGEIYASNSSTVTWTKIRCVNYSSPLDLNYTSINLTSLEAQFGFAPDDVDGFDETFGVAGLLPNRVDNHTDFYVGPTYIANGTCPSTVINQNDIDGTINFQEVLLTDNSSIVFTAIIENRANGVDTDLAGYNGTTTDFQMLVAENAHNGNTAATPYYFFVELE